MKSELWQKAVNFHGHECPGLAIGFKACEAAREKMGIGVSDDEQIVCVTENDACGVDAVQALLSCTFGKGNLMYRGTGKQAFSFFDRTSGKKYGSVLFPGRKRKIWTGQRGSSSFSHLRWMKFLPFPHRILSFPKEPGFLLP